jgi:hypothetical protein
MDLAEDIEVAGGTELKVVEYDHKFEAMKELVRHSLGEIRNAIRDIGHRATAISQRDTLPAWFPVSPRSLSYVQMAFGCRAHDEDAVGVVAIRKFIEERGWVTLGERVTGAGQHHVYVYAPFDSIDDARALKDEATLRGRVEMQSPFSRLVFIEMRG